MHNLTLELIQNLRAYYFRSDKINRSTETPIGDQGISYNIQIS